jgi:hypothetical protein
VIGGTDRTTVGAVACPYLGLDGDPRTRFLFATPAHRCHVRRRPAAIDLDHQGRFCLTRDFPTCPRFEASAPSAADGRGPRPTSRIGPGSPSEGQLLSVVEAVRPATIPTDASSPDTHRPVPDVLMPVASDTPRTGPAGRQGQPPTDAPPESAPRGLVRSTLVVLLALIALAALILAVATGAFGPLSGISPRAAGGHVAITRSAVPTVAIATRVVYADRGRV